MRILRHAITDDRGNVSHARIIALVVGFSATIFMWKLTVLGQLTETYFLYYLAYGVVHMNVSKALDVINNFLGRRNEGISTAPTNGRGPTATEGGDGRRGRNGPDAEDLRDFDDGAGVKTTETDSL